MYNHYCEMLKGALPTGTMSYVNLVIIVLALIVYTIQLLMVMRRHGKLIAGTTKCVLYLFWFYMVTRLVFSCIMVYATLSDGHKMRHFLMHKTSFLFPLFIYMQQGSLIIFQMMLFRLARIEIFMNPAYNNADEVKKRLRNFTLVTILVVATYVICLASPMVRFNFENNFEDLMDKDEESQ